MLLARGNRHGPSAVGGTTEPTPIHYNSQTIVGQLGLVRTRGVRSPVNPEIVRGAARKAHHRADAHRRRTRAGGARPVIFALSFSDELRQREDVGEEWDSA